MKYVILILLLTSNVLHAYGQACCSGGVPISGVQGLLASDKGAVQVLVTLDRNNISTLISNGVKQQNEGRKRVTNASLVEIGYGLSRRLSLSTLFTFVRHDRTVQNYFGELENTHSTGVGDAVLMSKFRLGNLDVGVKNSYSVGFGVKLPVGSTINVSENGILLPLDFQPGTGSVDEVFWLNNNRINLFGSARLSGLIDMSGRWTGAYTSFDGNRSFRFGHQMQIQTGVNYNSSILGTLMDVSLTTKYRLQGTDELDKQTLPNSGGQWLFIQPGIKIKAMDNLGIRITSDLPIIAQVEGVQLSTSNRTTLSLHYVIQNKKEK